jgi:hypothetical protein
MTELTGRDLRGTRKALALNQRQMAELLHYRGENGDRTIRNLESQEAPLSGPLAMALTYLRQGLLDEVMELVVPEYIIGEDMHLETGLDYILRMRWPRFVAILAASTDLNGLAGAAGPRDTLDLGDGSILAVAMWIDEPYRQDVQDLLRQAAAALRLHDVRSGIA